MVNIELTQIGQAGSHPGMQPLLIHPDTRDLEGSRFVHHARTPGLRLRSIPRTQIHSRSTCSKTSSALAVHSPWLRPSHPKAKLNTLGGKISEGSRICRFDKRYFSLIPAVWNVKISWVVPRISLLFPLSHLYDRGVTSVVTRDLAEPDTGKNSSLKTSCYMYSTRSIALPAPKLTS